MAELAAAGTAFSVVSSIITFGDVGRRIIKRVNEFVNDTGDVPEVLADIKAQLPLLIEKMDHLKSLCEERLQKIEPQSALAEAVTGCRSHIDRLENLVNKLQPQVTDSRTKKMKKAGQSMFYEDEISKILIKLEGYKTSFILHSNDIYIDLFKVTKKDESYHMVPYLQVSDYVERIDLLESIKSVVQQRREQQQRQVVVLLGMGGQGKSQLAMEYCRTARLSKEFRAIFWIDASSIKSTHRSFERIASKIADPSRIFENTEEKVAFVKDTMDGWDSRWLLVFDNYDVPSTDFNVAAFFPSSPFGTILVTSRHEDSKRLGKVIPLTKMTEQESLLLLLRRSENELTDENTATGKSIVAKLGFLPLAIDQAGAFIIKQKLPLTQFLERFDLQKEEILKYTDPLTEYKQILGDDVKETALNVFTTWELSFQQIQKGETGERLRSFLTTAAFFNTRDIGEDLFHSAIDLETVPIWMDAFISEGEWDSIRYEKVLAELSKLSLLNFALEDTKQCRFYLHPLIADWLRLRVSPEIRRLCTIESCYLLAKLIESTDLTSCSYAYRLYLLEHVDECLNNKRTYSTSLDADAVFPKIFTPQFRKLLMETSRYREGISLIEEALPIIETAYGKDHVSTLNTVDSLGFLYFQQGKFAEAEEMYKRALAGYEKALGKDHASTLDTVYNLGLLYSDQGKFVEAEEMYKRALAGYEKALGKDHASTLDTVNNLGLLYSRQGKFAEAEEMYKPALAGKEKALGKDHASTSTTVNNLGLLYSKQGKFAKAEEMYKCALAGYVKALGKDHALTLDTVNNLGRLYSRQGKFAEAEEMYKPALAGKEKALRKDHASTSTTVNNLGLLYSKQGKFAKAEEKCKRALAGNEEALGKDHVSTLDTVYNLGLLYSRQGRFAEAEEMYKRALAGYEKALGKDHALTLDTVNNLGLLYSRHGKFAEAEEMYKPALAEKEKAFGKDHASTSTTVNSLGLLYSKQGKFAKAEEMYKRALAGYEKALGKDHALTFKTVNNLGNLYSEQGKFAEAEEMYKHAQARYEKALGKDHVSTLDTVNNLGVLYSDQGKFTEAEEMYERALAGYEKALGKDHASTLNTVNNLGFLYSRQGKFAEAEEMYKRALAGYKKAPGKDHASTLNTVNNLGFLYSRQGKFAEAEEMYKSALAGKEKALGKDHASTFTTVNNLGLLYSNQGKFAEAEEMDKRAVLRLYKALTFITIHILNEMPQCDLTDGKRPDAILWRPDMVEDFITEVNNSDETGYFVCKAWLFSLPEHEREEVMFVLWRSGYLETYQNYTTMFYEKIEDDVQVPNTCIDPACTTDNNDICVGDTKEVIASDDIGALGKIEETAEKHNATFQLTSKTESGCFEVSEVHPPVSVLRAQSAPGPASVPSNETCPKESSSSLLHDQAEASLARSDAIFVSLKTAVQNRHSQILKTSTTSSSEYTRGHAPNHPATQRETANTEKNNIADDKERSSKVQQSGDFLPSDTQGTNMGFVGPYVAHASPKADAKCVCPPELLTVSFTPPSESPESPSSSHGEDGSAFSIRERGRDCHVKIPRREDYNVSTGVDKDISMTTVQYNGTSGWKEVCVSLNVRAETTLSCCLRRDHNKGVHIELLKIRGAMKINEPIFDHVNTEALVLMAVRTNVSASLNNTEIIHLRGPLERTVVKKYSPSDDKGQSQSPQDLVWLETSDEHPNNCETESTTLELQCDVPKRLRADTTGNRNKALVLDFPGNPPVNVEGEIKGVLDSNSSLELHVRYQSVISYITPRYPLPPPSEPIGAFRRVNRVVDYNSLLKIRTEPKFVS